MKKYPIVQKENGNFRVVGTTTIPQKGYICIEKYKYIKNKKEKNDLENKKLKLKPLNKIPFGFSVSETQNEKVFYEDGKFVRKKL